MKRFICVLLIIASVIASPCLAAESTFSSKDFYRSLSRRLGRKRTDYPNLTDKQFANFREVKTTGISAGKLFRSSSPISTWGERNIIADNFAREAGIKTFINLADTNQKMREHKGFSGSYYSGQKIIGLNLNMKYSSSKFRQSLAKGIHFMAVNDPPYLIHCSLGKDRAGFVCALIECLMGADIQEVTEDFLVSFYNYFGIVKGSEEYNFVAENEIQRFLAEAFGVKSLEGINLSEGAERYFIGIGVSREDINALKEKLRGNVLNLP